MMRGLPLTILIAIAGGGIAVILMPEGFPWLNILAIYLVGIIVGMLQVYTTMRGE